MIMISKIKEITPIIIRAIQLDGRSETDIIQIIQFNLLYPVSSMHIFSNNYIFCTNICTTTICSCDCFKTKTFSFTKHNTNIYNKVTPT